MAEEEQQGNQNNDDELKKMLEDALKDITRKVDDESAQKSSNESPSNDVLANMAKMFEGMADGQNAGIGAMMQNFISTLSNKQPNTPDNSLKLALQVAHTEVGSKGNMLISAEIAEKCKNAIQAANLWLDSEIDFPPPSGYRIQILTPTEWVDKTLPAWYDLMTPVTEATSQTLKSALDEQLNHFREMREEMGEESLDDAMKSAIGFNVNGLQGMLPIEGGTDSLSNAMDALNSSQNAANLGNAVGKLTFETFGATDYALPLLAPDIIMIPQNIENFAKVQDLPLNETISVLALREVAAVRLFAGVPWLKSYLLTALQNYASEISFDEDALEDKLMNLDMDTPDELQNMLEQGEAQFMSVTKGQTDAKRDLETVIALIEGWVDFVTFRAGSVHISQIAKFREVISRRRLEGASAEKAFGQVIGIDLETIEAKPAASFWEKLFYKEGAEGYNYAWKHQDSLPNSKAIDNPEGYFSGDLAFRGKIRTDDDGVKIEHDWDAML